MHHIHGTVGGLIWAELREDIVGGGDHFDVGGLWVGLKLHVSARRVKLTVLQNMYMYICTCTCTSHKK